MGQRGGARKGAGRKRGSKNAVTKIVAERIAASPGVDMLEIMTETARHYHAEALQAEDTLRRVTMDDIVPLCGDDQTPFDVLYAEVKKALNLRLVAHKCAADAAQYLHARPAPIDPKHANRGEGIPLRDRLTHYARQEAIADGSVIELKANKGA